MGGIAGPLASTVLVVASVAACNALTGASDLSPCATCEADATTPLPGDGVDASGDVMITGRDAAGPDDGGDASVTGDAAGMDAADGATGIGCQGAIACSRVVFVTSVEYNGDLGGIAGADAKCQALADASTVMRIKGGTFLAWVSTSTSTVSARFAHGSMPYVLGNGTIVANDWTDLTNGNLNHGIDQTEQGHAQVNGAWTGTTSVDALYYGQSCADWTSSAPAQPGAAGNVGGAGGGWSGATLDSCFQTNALYCFEK
jgi:hypothetical protein